MYMSLDESKFGWIRPWSKELAALESLNKNPIDYNEGNNVITFSTLFFDHQWERWCPHFFSAVYGRILLILAGNEDMYKSLDEFEFRPDLTTDNEVSCP